MKKKIFLTLAFCLFLGTSKVSAATVKSYFPDENLFNCVVTATIDEITNEPTLTETTDEADFDFDSVTELSCVGKDISSVKGIEKLTELQILNVASNDIETIDLSKNIKLNKINLFDNNISAIDLSKNTNLEIINLSINNLTSLDLSENNKLKELYVSKNKLTTIDLSDKTDLETLEAKNNELAQIDLSNNTKLTSLSLEGNPLLKNVDLALDEEFNYASYIKTPDGFTVSYIPAEEVVKVTDGKIIATKVGSENATLTIKNNTDNKKETFISKITVEDRKGSSEEKKTSDTTENPKTGIYGGSIVLVVCAVGVYMLMKNKNKYYSVR